MCIFRAPRPPEPPAPLPEPTVKPVNPAIREAQAKLGTKKGKKGSTADLRIDKNFTLQDFSKVPLNTGNTNTTGGIQ